MLSDKNITATDGAIEHLTKRGDINLIEKLINPNSLNDQSTWELFSDASSQYESNILLFNYVKCLNILHAKRTANIQAIADEHSEEVIPEFVSFEDFMRLDGEAAKYQLDFTSLTQEMPESDIVATQDIFVFQYLKEKGIRGFTDKQFHSGIASGKMNTDCLVAAIDLMLHCDAEQTAEQQAKQFFSSISLSEIIHLKVHAFDILLKTISEDEPTALSELAAVINPTTVKRLRNLAKCDEINHMNPNIRAKLNTILHFDE